MNTIPADASKQNGSLPGDINEHGRISIHIGGLYVSDQPLILDTVLGSCIAACMYDPIAGIGGMNHFMLPDGTDPNNMTSARYGVYAMELLINEMMKCGGKKKNFQAKIFGGGHVLRIRETIDGVPQRNILFARRFLDTEKIPVISEDVGGYHPRRVLFYTHSGKVFLRRMGISEAEQTAREELSYLSRLRKKTLDGDATLF
jgi:chemotaxis protein CheD